MLFTYDLLATAPEDSSTLTKQSGYHNFLNYFNGIIHCDNQIKQLIVIKGHLEKCDYAKKNFQFLTVYCAKYVTVAVGALISENVNISRVLSCVIKDFEGH